MKKLLAITLILTLVAATVALAQPAPLPQGRMCDGPGFGPQGKHMGMGMRHGVPGIRAILMHGDDIGLTDDQRDKLEDLMVTFKTEHVDLKADLDKARIKLDALLRDDADEASVIAAIDNVSRLKANIQKARYRNYTEAKKVLSPEQAEKLKQIRRGRMKNCPKSPGGGPRGGVGW